MSDVISRISHHRRALKDAAEDKHDAWRWLLRYVDASLAKLGAQCAEQLAESCLRALADKGLEADVLLRPSPLRERQLSRHNQVEHVCAGVLELWAEALEVRAPATLDAPEPRRLEVRELETLTHAIRDSLDGLTKERAHLLGCLVGEYTGATNPRPAPRHGTGVLRDLDLRELQNTARVVVRLGPHCVVFCSSSDKATPDVCDEAANLFGDVLHELDPSDNTPSVRSDEADYKGPFNDCDCNTCKPWR